MSNSHAVSAAFKQAMNEMHLHYHEELYDKIVAHLGPAIHDADASLVACSDKDELELIKNNFLKEDLGMTDEAEMDHLIQQVCHGLGESNPQKHRTTFYYLLVAISGNEAKFIATH
ncbi:MAG: DUF2853 family protein [Bacteroidota bacterium]